MENRRMKVYARHLVHVLLYAALGVAVNGCSTLDRVGWGKGEATRAGSGSTTGVYYSATDNLPLYRNPGAGIIDHLPKYTRLYRDDLQDGYAHVRVTPGSASGWVDNARLIWRLPAEAGQPEPVVPTSPTAADTAGPPAGQVESPVPAPAEPAAPSGPSVAPSIFNPY